jgi:RNA polymerase sigma-70 factor (ECF subfamily)
MLSSLSSSRHLVPVADDAGRPVSPAPSVPSELSLLLVRLADGDRRAFRQLYDKTSSRMLGAALRIMGDPALAEDAVQEAYLRVWRSAARFDPERGEAMSWMGRIVRNVCFDRLPKDRDMARIEDVEIAVLPVDPPDARLHACLKQLPENQSRALILMYVHGMTHPELAAYMNAPLGTVKSWINRGSHALRLMMGNPE